MIKQRHTRGAVALALLAMVAAGCGGAEQPSQGDGQAANAAQPASAISKPSRPAEVSTGTPIATPILVNEFGFTLYSDGNDTRNSGESSCYGACERQWTPYLTAGAPVVWQDKPQVKKELLGTIRRSNGVEQVTYAGYPLYLFKNEPTAEATGLGKNSFGATWFVVQLDGTRIDQP